MGFLPTNPPWVGATTFLNQMPPVSRSHPRGGLAGTRVGAAVGGTVTHGVTFAGALTFHVYLQWAQRDLNSHVRKDSGFWGHRVCRSTMRPEGWPRGDQIPPIASGGQPVRREGLEPPTP